MTREQHAKILSAYLSRLTSADTSRICSAAERTFKAQMNGNSTEQLEAQAELDRAIGKAVGWMIEHDLELIEQLIRQSQRKY